jgi:hypothetical protein
VLEESPNTSFSSKHHALCHQGHRSLLSSARDCKIQPTHS